MAKHFQPATSLLPGGLSAFSRAGSVFAAELGSVRWSQAWRVLLIIAAGWWVYWPALRGGLMIDDTFYIADNLLLRDAAGLWKILFVPGSFLEYYPLEGAVLWVEWHLWHLHMLGYHIVNLSLHVIDALLVWRLFERLGLRLAWLGGLIFAVHPVQVETAAWISELKNTLSLAPFLLAMCFYIDYDRHHRQRDYYLALALFLVAMLCKITMALFPLVILLYAWWKRDRVTRQDLGSAAPFFAVSLALSMTTQLAGMIYRNFGSEGPLPLGGFFSRLACGGLSLSFYFSKAVLPVALEPLYPQWEVNPPSPVQFLPWLVVIGVFWVLWKKRHGWGRHVLLGLGFFVINLLPFLGFNAISYMHATWVMDHFLYLPVIGIIGLAVAAAGHLGSVLAPPGRTLGAAVLAAAVAWMAWQSHSYALAFVDEFQMWTHYLEINPQSSLAHANVGAMDLRRGNLNAALEQYKTAVGLDPTDPKIMSDYGTVLAGLGRNDEAIDKYEKALAIDPVDVDADFAYANVLRQQGRLNEAIGKYREALRLYPKYAEAHNNLGSALVGMGHLQEGLDEYAAALDIDPNYAEAHFNLGSALMQAGRLPGAMEEFEIALRINPNYAQALSNLGNALAKQGRYPEAIEEYRAALRIDPNIAEAHNGLGGALQQSGQEEEAAEQYLEAIKLKPNYAEARLNLGMVLSRLGLFADAREQIEAAIPLLPGNPMVLTSLGNVYLRAGKFTEAEEQYRKALKLDPDFAEAHNNLGAALEQDGKPRLAADEYREALRINPNDEQARENLDRVTGKKPAP